MHPDRILTDRQLEFLAMSAQGMTYDQIASTCFVAWDTVKNALADARDRLGAKNTPHAVALAISLELVVFDPNSDVFVAPRLISD